MFKRLHQKGTILAAALLVALGLGLALPMSAMADPEQAYNVADVKLTKVIVGAMGTDASGDSYVFHFAGGGEVTEVTDTGPTGEPVIRLYSDGVEQDNTTIAFGDVVPTIPDVTLAGVLLTVDNSLTNGQVAQTVVQKSMAEILTNVTFPHAGVYTYVVTEQSADTKLTDGTYINASKASFRLRIRVENSKTEQASVLGNTELDVESVTVERITDDNGGVAIAPQEGGSTKVAPDYPKTDANGKITQTSDGVAPAPQVLAGDERGRNVPGFTFANEYINGGSFTVKKLYDGTHSDRTKYMTVELTVYSEAAKSDDAKGSCLTYRIEGEGIDLTENPDDDGEHRKLNGIYSNISQTNDYMATFDDEGWAYIKAELKEDSIIRITGEFGPYKPEYAAEAPNGKDKRMTLSTSGLIQGQTYYVIERNVGDYRPTGYTYAGEASGVDPRKDWTGMQVTPWLENPDVEDPTDTDHQTYFRQFDLLLQGEATGKATTVFVVNKIDEAKVSVTGIFIDNLPYLLMVGVPLAVFALMFVGRRRRNLAA